MTPGQRLKAVMEIANISQIELAELCGTSQPTIHRMLKDQQKLNFKVLAVLRKRYKVDINPFFEGN